MAKKQTEPNQWPAPARIRWSFWLGLYLLAIALNRHYAPKLAGLLQLEKLTPLQTGLLALLPALLLVTLMLLLRWCWYQGWLIYHRANQWVYEEKIRQNQRYWSESVQLQEVVFCCGQINDLKQLLDYRRQTDVAGILDKSQRKMDLATYSEQPEHRLEGLLSRLAQELQQRKLLAEDNQQSLWLWLGDAASWQLFRAQVNALGGMCPTAPDRYIKGLEINWLIDRAQESQYRRILLLGYECVDKLELLLLLIFAPEGRLARLGRAFSVEHWAEQQPDFMAMLPSGMVQLQLCSESFKAHQFEQWGQHKNLTVTGVSLDMPNFAVDADRTGAWLWLLCTLDRIDSYPLMVEQQRQLLMIAPVRSEE
ncbi:hypothetical protein PT286_02480 [Neisseriaceae bacterium ESL0693]|nr:hypothetical protein [Neisseriaceae bacterium ESL0693]